MFLTSRAHAHVGACVVSADVHQPGRLPAVRARGGTVRLCIVRKGDLRILVGGQPQTLSAGDGLIAGGRAVVSMRTTGGCELVTVTVPRAALGADDLEETDVSPVLRQQSLLPAIAGFAATLFHAPEARGQSGHHFELLLRDMLRAVLVGMATTGQLRPMRSLVNRSISAMWERHADTSLTPAMIAAHVNLSLRQLEREFRAEGKTIRGELRRVRVESATALLTDPLLAASSIDQIARQVGFSNGSSLARAMAAEQMPSPARLRAGRSAAGRRPRGGEQAAPVRSHTPRATSHTRSDRFPGTALRTVPVRLS